MAKALKGTTAAMVKMNKQMNLPAMQKIMVEFQAEEMKAEMTMEMMGDTMDDVMEGENDEEEEAAIVSQILDEIGIDASMLVPDAPQFKPLAGKNADAESASAEEAAQPLAMGMGSGESGGSGGTGGGGSADPAVSELEERLNNLRRN